jgi:hypothetical protein
MLISVTAIVADIVRHNPGGTPDPSNLQLVTLPVLLIIEHVRGYRPRVPHGLPSCLQASSSSW